MNYVEDRIPEPTNAEATMIVLLLAFSFGLMHHNRLQKSSLFNTLSLIIIYLLMWSLGALISWVFSQLPVVFSTNYLVIVFSGAIPLLLCCIFWNQLRAKPVWLVGRFVLASILYAVGIHIAEYRKHIVWANQLELAPSFTSEEHVLVLARWSLVSVFIVNLLFFALGKIIVIVSFTLTIPEVAALLELLQSSSITQYLVTKLSRQLPQNPPSEPKNDVPPQQERREAPDAAAGDLEPDGEFAPFPRDEEPHPSVVRHRYIAAYWEEQKTLVGPLSPAVGISIGATLALLGFMSSFSSYSYLKFTLMDITWPIPLWALPVYGAFVAFNSINEGEPVPEAIEEWLKVPPHRRKKLE